MRWQNLQELSGDSGNRAKSERFSRGICTLEQKCKDRKFAMRAAVLNVHNGAHPAGNAVDYFS
jgi:hypothetical protein